MFDSRSNPNLGVQTGHFRELSMLMIVPMFAAAGYSILYLLLGGGFGGAILIFIIAKLLGK